MSTLDIKHLRTLTALRDGGTLVEAARRLHLTQSALSHQLKDLEERLGVSLFLRKTKPLRFTRAGLEVLQLADQLLPQIQQTERNLKKLAGGDIGRLHMAIECHSCFDWLMPAINAFRDHWPEVEIDLSTSFNFEDSYGCTGNKSDEKCNDDDENNCFLFHFKLLLFLQILS